MLNGGNTFQIMLHLRCRRTLKVQRALRNSTALHGTHDTLNYCISACKILFKSGLLKITKISGEANISDVFTKCPQPDMLMRHLQRIGTVAATSNQIFTIK